MSCRPRCNGTRLCCTPRPCRGACCQERSGPGQTLGGSWRCGCPSPSGSCGSWRSALQLALGHPPPLPTTALWPCASAPSTGRRTPPATKPARPQACAPMLVCTLLGSPSAPPATTCRAHPSRQRKQASSRTPAGGAGRLGKGCPLRSLTAAPQELPPMTMPCCLRWMAPQP